MGGTPQGADVCNFQCTGCAHRTDFAADITSHATVQSSLPTASELRHMANDSVGALGAKVGPMILPGLAQIGVIETDFALHAGQRPLVAALRSSAFSFLYWNSSRTRSDDCYSVRSMPPPVTCVQNPPEKLHNTHARRYGC